MKSFIQKLIQMTGHTIYKDDCRFHPEKTAKHLCSKMGIDTILDVGANTGQYALALRKFDYRGKILSFEPLTSAYEKLTKNAANDDLWIIAPRCAIGKCETVTEINISANSVSSSLLPMRENHVHAAPESRYIASESVSVFTLSDQCNNLLTSKGPYYLKIDTQGYERQVIDGAMSIIDRIPVIQLELSITELYEGCLLLKPGIELMTSMGYRIYSIITGLTDRHTGETLQVDVIFTKSTNNENKQAFKNVEIHTQTDR